jgi:hypothetical protein
MFALVNLEHSKLDFRDFNYVSSLENTRITARQRYWRPLVVG